MPRNLAADCADLGQSFLEVGQLDTLALYGAE
jgi:hypothetical protein